MSQPAQRMSRLAKDKDAPAGSPTASPIVNFLPTASSDFVLTPYVQDLTDRALAYLQVGYAVHLSGPAGTGKSTLAMHIASRLARTCTLLHGDDEYRGSDLIGRDSGYRRTSIRDNYVSSIVKTEETLSTIWASNRLTTACQQGHTLIYDEFTRSPATANNPLLSVLEERILNIPSTGDEKGYIKVHPEFRAIFTSNPEEYAGVHKTQDALLDRMITIELDHPDQETEASIVVAKSGLTMPEALLIVGIIREVRERCGQRHGPTVRAALAISQIITHRGCKIDVSDPVFQITCQDVLYFNASRQTNPPIDRQVIRSIVNKVCGGAGPRKSVTETATRLTRNNSTSAIGSTSRDTHRAEVSSIASEEADLLDETSRLVQEARIAANSTQSHSTDVTQVETAVKPAETKPETLGDQAAGSDESLQVAMKNFENLSAAVRHLVPSARTLPRPPALATKEMKAELTPAP